MSFDNDIDIMDSIEACRTCGVFFLTSSSFLRQIFTSAVDDPEMMLIRMELTSWKVEINENDGYPQFICTGCIHEFQKVFKFRRSCIDIQDQLRHFYNVRNQNQIKIKSEIPDEVEENECDFIYVDDLSDAEYDGATPFNIPHVPIKEEIYEAAIPAETPIAAIDTANTNIESDIMEPPPSNIGKEIESANFPSEVTEDNALDEDSNARVEDLDEANQADNEVTTSASTSFVKCEYCNCISPNIQQHKLHVKRFHEARDVECHICGKKFKNSSATRLKFHLKWHKISRHIKCAQCGFFCSSREMLREHTRQMHIKDKCSICGKSVLPKRMKYHMRTHGLDTLFECTYCTQVFSTSSGVSAHITKTHTSEVVARNSGIEEKNTTCVEVACAVCDQKFINQVELQHHVQEQHLAEANNDLSKCNEEYPMFRTNNEVATENCNDFEPSYSVDVEEPVQVYCANCHQNFANSDELTQHVPQCPQIEANESAELFRTSYNGIESDYLDNYQNQQHSQENDYVDDQSYTDGSLPDVAVENIADMDESINEINNFNPVHNFGCAQCTDTFESVEQLRNHHDRMHSKKPNFNCQVCGKVFELKFSLNRHMKKHDNV